MKNTIAPARPLAREGRGEAGRSRHAHCAGLLLLALTACTPQTIVKDRIERINVPVRVGCVTNDVPKTPPLKSRYTQDQWDHLTVPQKAAAVSAQGIRRMNETDAHRAATAGCPKA